MRASKSHSVFTKFTKWTARVTGRPVSFILAVAVVLAWGLTGPFFHFSDTWQLVINTSTTVITFLMVFLIQATQNRDTQALQVKLDDIIRSLEGAHNVLLDLEELEESELDEIREKYCRIAKRAREELRKGKHDTGVVDFDDALVK